MNMIDEILENREKSWIHLAEIATNQKYCEDSNKYSVWAPICAIHLLAVIGDYKCHLAINSALLVHADDPSDWITDEMPHVVSYMNNSGIHMITLMLQDSTVDQYVRSGMVHALVMIATQDEKSKKEIIQNIIDIAQKESDIDLRTMIVDTLLDLRDPSLYNYLKNSLETGFVTDEFFDIPWLDAMYSNSEHGKQDLKPRDPLDIFSDSPENFYRKTNNHPNFAQDIGRNEKCPCGSGKKYKKCCMKIL